MIEILLILSVTVGILSIGLSSHDNAEMGGLLSPCIVAIAWMWFISLPLFVIYATSFIRSIPPVSIYKKIVLSLHILNVALWVLFYLFLPKPNPCDAALMEKHYKNHHAEMYDLVKYVRNTLDDSCSIILQYRNDKVLEFTIGNKRDYKKCEEIENEHKLDTILHSVGLSMRKLKEIQGKMHKAGVIGIEIDKNPKSQWIGKSILLFRWYGVNRYQYALYDHSMTEKEKDEVLRLHQFILYNDSVVFESYGGYPGGRGFPDKDKFQSQHNGKQVIDRPLD
ncbi:MAG: hypothetical protein J6X07_09650 [Prevotella sp.]|nr:hypothetical protein [Prevotella sp.]